MGKRRQKQEARQNAAIDKIRHEQKAEKVHENVQGRKFEDLEEEIKRLKDELEQQKLVNIRQEGAIEADDVRDAEQQAALDKLEKQ